VSRELGFGIVNWSVDTLDWKTRNTNSVYNAVVGEAADHAIVLNHDLYRTTADAMERIIPELISKGYQFVTVTELLYYSDVAFEAGKVYNSAK
jgi:peptidoglycan/xylan/chitin deacetylase (PgdA/CDA1 family)